MKNGDLLISARNSKTIWSVNRMFLYINVFFVSCFGYCSWPHVQQKSRLLIGLNRILLRLNNSTQITKSRSCSKEGFKAINISIAIFLVYDEYL